MTISEFQGVGLTETQWQQLRVLATALDSKQLIWVSGFFAGLGHKTEGETAVLARPPGPIIAGQAVAGRRLTILYGSETSNGAAVAAALREAAASRGLTARLEDMGAYKTKLLKDEEDLLLVTSTHGEGDPPPAAADFFDFIEGRKAPKLPNIRFAVLALGDSTYEYFCEAGKRLDRRLEELGAVRLKPRIDCDVDYEAAADLWVAEILDRIDKLNDRPTATAISTAQPSAAATSFDKRNPYAARIVENIVLTGRGSTKETRHIELSLEGSGLAFEPGDALGIMPSNDPARVETMLGELGLVASTVVKVKGEALPLGEALASRFEIAAVTPRFIEYWAGISDADELKQLSQPARSRDRISFMRHHHLIDVVRRFPVEGVDATTLVEALRPLQPRLYSIASSLAAMPDEVHLTVATVRYELHGERRSGIATGQLADRAEPDSTLPVYVQSNSHFRLPADDVAIIMVGAGTGVAPFRAFLQQREANGATGRSWLLFGERHFRTDFLYQTEWQSFLRNGVLSRMDVAFSRDHQREAMAKDYVQHRLNENARDIFAWMEEGAHLYVCGDATRLAPDVHQTLKSIVEKQGNLSAARAEDYLSRLQSDHRYQLDVY